MSIRTITEAIVPLADIADAWDNNNLDDDARRLHGADSECANTTPAARIELFAGRGGQRLLTLDQCLAGRDALASRDGDLIDAALEPLVKIARAWDSNALDDEARKFHGPRLERRATISPSGIALVCGRGGKCLLTLDDALEARAARAKYRDDVRAA